MAGKQHGGPDRLSRKPPAESDILAEEEDDVDDYIVEKLDTLSIHVKLWLNPDRKYTANEMRIAEYLQTMKKPPEMNIPAFRSFRSYATNFLVMDGDLYRRRLRGRPPGRVVADKHERQQIARLIHESERHTANGISRWNYWWPGMEGDIDKAWRECDECETYEPRNVCLICSIKKKKNFASTQRILETYTVETNETADPIYDLEFQEIALYLRNKTIPDGLNARK